VARVYDGDTLRLKDGRKVRLIGFDAPEVGYEGKASQPFGDEARSTLEAHLRGEGQIGLRYDAVRSDSYGRTLAHLFLPDGSDLAAEMLVAGLGTTLSLAPNLWNEKCYREREAEAQRQQKGVWRLPALEADSLTLADGGFHRVYGRVVRVGDGRKSVWVQLEGLLTVRIPRNRLRNFSYDPHTLVGRRVLTHGRIYTNDRQLLLTVQDPSEIQPQAP
jgi:hypothetical protein